jgi:hypothetical protein
LKALNILIISFIEGGLPEIFTACVPGPCGGSAEISLSYELFVGKRFSGKK